MEKIYGFKESDVLGFAEYINANPQMPLSKLFSEYALICNKAQGTVRNLYYAIARLSVSDKDFCKRVLNGKSLSVSKNQEFSKVDEKWLVDSILEYKNKGLSVRSAVYKLANNDAKLALRYQNKFRNLCKSNADILKNYNNKLITDNQSKINNELKISKIPDTLMLKLKKEIDGLLERVSSKVRRENIALKKRISFLEAENIKLTNMLLLGERPIKVSSYFSKREGEKLFS